MRNNYTQSGVVSDDGRIHVDNDWFHAGLPANISLGENVFIDTSYGYTQFYSKQPNALTLGEATGSYDRSSLITAEGGVIAVGKYVILNGTSLVCKESITIGDHCMFAWGSVVTDSWFDASIYPVEVRRSLIKKAAADPLRRYPFFGEAKPVVIEENSWIGFDSVILPGVTLGRGCIVGSKTIIHEDVPPYAIIAGDPPRVIRFLDPSDTTEQKKKAIAHFLNKPG